jgi:hypothetical protein
MLVSEAIKKINDLGDDSIEEAVVLSWINDALAQIGARVRATYPELTLTTESMPLPDKWTRILVIPYATGRMKQQDSSQFEYSDLYAQFLANLDEFASQYVVPEIYKDPDLVEGQTSDIYTVPPFPWGGRW